MVYLSLALAVATFPAVPGSEQLEKDILAIQTAKVDTIALDFSKCVAEKIRAHAPQSDEKGDRGKAELFLEGALATCNHTDATTRVRAGLTSTKPEKNSVDIDRQVGAAFAFPMLGLLMLLNKTYEIGPITSRRESPVEIEPPGK